MQVLYAFFAQAADSNPDGTFTAMGADIDGLEGTLPFSIPQISLVSKLSIQPEETGKEHSFVLKVTDPAGNVAKDPATMMTTFTPPESPEAIGMMLIIRLTNLKYTAYGAYKWHIIVDETELKHLYWRVIPNEQPAN